MDGGLKRELRKLEHEYDYERSLNLGRFVPKIGDSKAEINGNGHNWLHSPEPAKKKKRKIFHLGFTTKIYNDFRNRTGTLRMVLADWIFLAILGIVVACLSSTIDTIVYHLQKIQEWSINLASPNHLPGVIWMYLAWVLFFTIMIVTSATIVHYIAPQAIGSGIPEMKTIIRGVILKDYLTFRTLLSKVLGLIFALGSGAPIGKMGPFVHIASVVANQLCLLAARFDRAFGSETRRIETFSAACAIGVACTFSAPVGGVLFSIEVTTMYFSVRNYWRGFFGACCGAITIRLLKGFFAETEVTTSAFYQTNFTKDPYVVDELPLFAMLGIICGLLGAAYIAIYKHLVLFLRTSQFAKKVFQKRWLVYPIVVSLILGALTFPYGLGQFFVGRLRFARNLKDFYTNCTFTASIGSPLFCEMDYQSPFVNPELPHNVLLSLYISALFILSIVSITLPIPGGVFMPVIVLGAGIGRLMGEITSQWAPNGIVNSHLITPGVYAVAGSAAFSGAVTHSVSVAVIVFEATGQLHCLLPVMIAVILSNAISTYLQPSFFDTIIKIKHLPFLPDIPPSSNIVHTTVAEDMMTSPVRFLSRITTYEHIRKILTEGQALRIFPVVDAEATQMLVGTVNRRTLLEILEEHVGDAARKAEAESRVRRAIETIDRHFKNTQEAASSDPELPTVQSEGTLPRRTFSEGMRTMGVIRNRSASPRQPNQDLPTEQPQGSESKPRFVISPSTHQPRSSGSTSPEISLSRSDSGHSKKKKPKMRKVSSAIRRNAFCSMEAQKEHHLELPKRNLSDLQRANSLESIHPQHFSIHSFHVDYQRIMKGYLRQAKSLISNLKHNVRKESSHFTLYDLTGVEREEWEQSRMNESFVMPEEFIDPSPFQLVRRTTLYKIHSIFSMLQMTKAYVTDCGRLVGVVALCDVRAALENSQSTTEPSTEPKKPKDSAFHEALKDVLTPAIEVVNPSPGRRGSQYIHVEEDAEVGILQKPPSMRVRQIGDERRPTILNEQAEEVVGAVAYLRRKSTIHHVPRRRDSGHPFASLKEQRADI